MRGGQKGQEEMAGSTQAPRHPGLRPPAVSRNPRACREQEAAETKSVSPVRVDGVRRDTIRRVKGRMREDNYREMIQEVGATAGAEGGIWKGRSG